MTFKLAIRTAEDKEADALAERALRVKKECERRILEVADQWAQTNLIGAAAAGRLNQSDKAVYVKSVDWVADMRAACAAIIADPGLDASTDANWPTVPAGVAALVARY